MKPPANPKPAINPPDSSAPDRRQIARETARRTTGSRAPIMPQERTDQPRKHGQHRGPRPKE